MSPVALLIWDIYLWKYMELVEQDYTVNPVVTKIHTRNIIECNHIVDLVRMSRLYFSVSICQLRT